MRVGDNHRWPLVKAHNAAVGESGVEASAMVNRDIFWTDAGHVDPLEVAQRVVGREGSGQSRSLGWMPTDWLERWTRHARTLLASGLDGAPGRRSRRGYGLRQEGEENQTSKNDL